MKTDNPLLLNGKPFELKPSVLPVFRKLIEFLETLPDNEVLDKRALVEKRVVSRDTVCRASQECEAFKPYCLMTRAGDYSQARYLYGNLRAIAALKKLIEAQS